MSNLLKIESFGRPHEACVLDDQGNPVDGIECVDIHLDNKGVYAMIKVVEFESSIIRRPGKLKTDG